MVSTIGWMKTTRGTLQDIGFLRERIEESSAHLAFATTAAAIEQARSDGKTAVLMCSQNTRLIDDEVSLLDMFWDVGMRIVQLTYNEANLVGDGCTEPRNGGLTQFGEAVVKRMNRLGMLIDGSHTGKQTTLDAMALSDAPVVFTHANARAISDSARNIDDEQIEACAETGGVIGINAFGAFVKAADPTSATIEDYLDHIDYVVRVAGIDHVGIGLDQIETMDWYAEQGVGGDPNQQRRPPGARRARRDLPGLHLCRGPRLDLRVPAHHGGPRPARLRRAVDQEDPRAELAPGLPPGLGLVTTPASARAMLHPEAKARVEATFWRHLEQGLHPGAALAVYHGEDLVIDLFAGAAEAPRDVPVLRDTMFVLFSCSKPLASMSVWACVDRGLLEIDAPIASYWPEFAGGGKGAVTARQVLAHTGGFPTWPVDLRWDELVNWDRIVESVARAPLEYEAGTTLGYHSFNHGWVCGEIVRRTSGRPIGAFFHDEIAVPLGLDDTYLGPPASVLPRVAKVHPYPDILWEHVVFADRFNQPEMITAPIPASNGVATARDMARFYAAVVNDGELDGRPVWSAASAQAATAVEAEGHDVIHDRYSRRSAGFVLGGERVESIRMGSNTTNLTFGHGGAGTCITWGDRELGLSMAYLMNGYRGDTLMSERNREMSDAVRELVPPA